jgi:hypothetical protein
VLAPLAVRAPARAITYIVLSTHLARNLLWILDRWSHRYHEATNTILGERGRQAATGEGREGGREEGREGGMEGHSANTFNSCAAQRYHWATLFGSPASSCS